MIVFKHSWVLLLMATLLLSTMATAMDDMEYDTMLTCSKDMDYMRQYAQENSTLLIKGTEDSFYCFFGIVIPANNEAVVKTNLLTKLTDNKSCTKGYVAAGEFPYVKSSYTEKICNDDMVSIMADPRAYDRTFYVFLIIMDMEDVNDEQYATITTQYVPGDHPYTTTTMRPTVPDPAPSPGPTPPPGSCYCGMTKEMESKIVGGEAADKYEYPWMAALFFVSTGQQFCAGTIINSRNILTAAHCSEIVTSLSSVKVHLSEHNKLVNDGEMIFDVSKIKIHPNYDPATIQNDFAIWRLAEEIKFVDYENIRPICLPPDGFDMDDYVGDMAWATGWGTTSAGGLDSAVLLEVEIPVISNDECEDAYPGKIYPNMICAGSPGKDACQGDSGGPLSVINDYGAHEVVGVTSWGIGCATNPGVWARVTQELKWIKKEADGGVTCPVKMDDDDDENEA